MKRVATYLLMFCVAFMAMGQDKESSALHFDLDKHSLSLPFNIQPLKPQLTLVSPNIVSPTFKNYVQPEPLKLDYKFNALPDSVKAMPELNAGNYIPTHADPVYDFHGNPYSRDWSASGIIKDLGYGLYMTGSGGYTTYPGLGTIGSATVGLTGTVDERLTISAGVTGSKYHFDRDAWNDYGIYANASYQLSDRFSLNAFGSYSLSPRYHSMASMGYIQTANYGATLGIKFSDKFGLNVGAQRYYDPYTRTWRTLPIIAPSINLFGAPISVDVGSIIYQFIKGSLKSEKEAPLRFQVTPTGGGGVPIRPVEPRIPSARAAGGTIIR